MANLLLQNMLGTSILIAALLAMYPLFCRLIRPQARYAAWIIVCVGMLIPFGLVFKPLMTISTPQVRNPVVVTTPAPVVGARLLEMTATTQTNQGANVVAANPAPKPTLQAAGMLSQSQAKPSIHFQLPDLYTACLMIWALGAFATMVFQCIRHIRFFRRVRRWQTPVEEAELQILAEEIKRLTLTKRIRFKHCVCVGSPMVVGLFRPTLLMPEQELTMDERRLIIRHELTHIKRHDLWGKALMLVCLTVYWFNPLVRAMARAMASDCEMSCDASVLASTDLSVRKFYGETILGVINRQRKQQIALSTYFYEGKKDMKNRFTSMFDTSRKSKGNAFLAGMVALVLMAGSAFAVTTTAPITGLPTQDSATITQAEYTTPSWTEHKTPALFGINSSDYPQYYTGIFEPDIVAYSRDFTRGELLRYHDLVHHYYMDQLRADEPASVAPAEYTGEAFAISAPLAEFVSMIPLEKRDGNFFGSVELWASAKEAGLMPFLLLPNQEMTDQELLQLVEVVDAFDAQVPFFDPTEQGSENNNRRMTFRETMRYHTILAICEKDENYRPTVILSDNPIDGLYIKGYNGGGETVYHYPEDREMTDDELLQIAYEIVKIRKSYQAEEDYAYEVEQEQIKHQAVAAPIGTAEEAEAKLRAIMGDVNVITEGRIGGRGKYNQESQTWYFYFEEDVPAAAPKNSYIFEIDMSTGELLLAQQDYFAKTMSSYLLGDMPSANLSTMVVDATDPHWSEVAKTYLDQGYFYQGAAVSKMFSDTSMNNFCVKVEYEDGAKAYMFIDPASQELKGYHFITDAEIEGNQWTW